jgi:hypothetical protein
MVTFLVFCHIKDLEYKGILRKYYLHFELDVIFSFQFLEL